MRKTIIVIFVFACLFNFTLITAQQRLHMGLQSGIVFSRAGLFWNGSSTSKPNYNLEWMITNASNAYFNYELTPKLSLTAEPGYIQKTDDQNVALTYIQLPLLAEFALVDKLRLTAGPELNFLLNNDAQKSYKTFDTAAQFGIYYGVSYTFDLGVKYSRSLGNFLRKDIDIKTGENFYHYYFQFYTRYRF